MPKTYNRQVALDTETTGMDIAAGNRLISIGCVEIVGRSITKRTFYKLMDPQREVEEGAAKVHGYTWDKLKGKPLFEDIVDDFLAFMRAHKPSARLERAYFSLGDREKKTGNRRMAKVEEGTLEAVRLLREELGDGGGERAGRKQAGRKQAGEERVFFETNPGNPRWAGCIPAENRYRCAAS